jgi:DNA replicative helicase MCM subunit Mcm2 (Cdc46/Mcm family)
METLQTYIKVCRALKPVFTKEAAEILKKEYCDLR